MHLEIWQKFIIGLILIAVVSIGLSVYFNTPSSWFAAPIDWGKIPSDIFVTAVSQVVMATNDPKNQIQGSVVMVDMALGAGSDIVVGSYDTEKMKAQNVEPSFDNPDFYFAAVKQKMNTILPIKIETVKVIQKPRYIDSSNTIKTSPLAFCFISAEERLDAQRNLAQNEFLKCKANLSYIAFGWKPYSDKVAAPAWGAPCYPLSAYYPQIITACVGTEKQFDSYDFGSKTMDVEIPIQLKNVNNEYSSSGMITEDQPQVKLYNDVGQLVGHATWTGNLSAWELPIDLTDDSPGNYFGQWYNFGKSKINDYMLQLAATRSAAAYDDIRFANCRSVSDCTGNHASVIDKVDNYLIQAWDKVVISRILTVDGRTFTPTGNSFVINQAFASNPKILLVVDADWIGIIRRVADFKITCAPGGKSQEGIPITSGFTVENISGTYGNYTVSWNCPGTASSLSESLASGSSKSYTVKLDGFANQKGDCTISISYGGMQKSCTIAYEFTARPVLCGNGITDTIPIAENCNNCPQDVKCAENQYCADDGTCKLSDVEKCPNNKIDEGETCDNCPKDMEYILGEGYCAPPQDDTLLIILGIIGGTVIVVFLYLIYRKYTS